MADSVRNYKVGELVVIKKGIHVGHYGKIESTGSNWVRVIVKPRSSEINATITCIPSHGDIEKL